jgi:hypothetical protein
LNRNFAAFGGWQEPETGLVLFGDFALCVVGDVAKFDILFLKELEDVFVTIDSRFREEFVANVSEILLGEFCEVFGTAPAFIVDREWWLRGDFDNLWFFEFVA